MEIKLARYMQEEGQGYDVIANDLETNICMKNSYLIFYFLPDFLRKQDQSSALFSWAKRKQIFTTT